MNTTFNRRTLLRLSATGVAASLIPWRWPDEKRPRVGVRFTDGSETWVVGKRLTKDVRTISGTIGIDRFVTVRDVLLHSPDETRVQRMESMNVNPSCTVTISWRHDFDGLPESSMFASIETDSGEFPLGRMFVGDHCLISPHRCAGFTERVIRFTVKDHSGVVASRTFDRLVSGPRGMVTFRYWKKRITAWQSDAPSDGMFDWRGTRLA